MSYIQARMNVETFSVYGFEAPIFHPREISSGQVGEGKIFGLGLRSQASTHRSEKALRSGPKDQVPKVTTSFQMEMELMVVEKEPTSGPSADLRITSCRAKTTENKDISPKVCF